MLNTSDITYSVQPAGARARVLATSAQSTRTVVTLEPATAATVVHELNTLVTSRTVLLHLAAVEHPGAVATIRRTAIAAVLNGLTATRPAFIEPLAQVVVTVSTAERRAVADEVARLFDGTDDVLVPVTLSGEYGEACYFRLANDWLATAADAGVLAAVDPLGDGAVLHEGLLAHLRERDAEVENALVTEWLDIAVDATALVAWVRHNRPHLADRLDELLAED